MERIWDKLRRQDGASLLIAFLFFLLCSMVGVSILMAAVSNAGKIHSNRQEQQKYLTLSSALRLVCDELNRAQYTANCLYVKKEPEQVKDIYGNLVFNDDGSAKMDREYTIHTYTQGTGQYTGSGLAGGHGTVLPLLPELDWLFTQKSLGLKPADTAADHYVFEISPGTMTQLPQEHVITLEAQVDPSDESGLGAPVKVTVRLGTDPAEEYKIFLTAVLADEESYSMFAELYTAGNLPALGYTGPLKWELGWIAKEAAHNEPVGP